MIAARVIRDARETPLTDALDMIGVIWQYDLTFKPRANRDTRLVLVDDQIEMIMTGPVFLLRQRGRRHVVVGQGRGAIDLIMQLTGCGFPAAIRQLRANNKTLYGRKL